MTVEVLREVLPREIVNDLWQKACIGEGVKAKCCVACQRLMVQVPVIVADEPEFIDVCTGCHFMWFDPTEFERFPKIEIPKPDYEKLPDKAKRELALANLVLLQQQQLPQDGIYRPDHWWQIILTLFGMPIEYNPTPLRQRPIATWTLAAIIARWVCELQRIIIYISVSIYMSMNYLSAQGIVSYHKVILCF